MLSWIFLSKRMWCRYYTLTKNEGGNWWGSWHQTIICIMFILSVWFFMLLVKICSNWSLEWALLLMYPLITYILMLKFSSKKYVKCNHLNWVQLQGNDNLRSECAPYEVLQIIKSWIFHSGEYVWFCVLLPLGFIESNELYINSYQVIMSGVAVAGNSFFLLSTFNLIYLRKFIGERDNKQTKTEKVEETEEKQGSFMSSIMDIHSNSCTSRLCTAVFENPGRTYMMLLMCQTLLCLFQLFYCCVRTQFLFPLIQAGMSVFVLMIDTIGKTSVTSGH